MIYNYYLKMNISFGKYKGTSFKNIIINDKQYIKWLVSTDWFKNRDEHNVKIELK